MQQYVVDTNAVGYLQNGDPTIMGLLANSQLFISELTEMELLCRPRQSKAQHLLTQDLIDDCVIVNLSAQVKAKAIQVRLATGMKLIDSIIAATAIVLDMPIITHDQGFERLGNMATVILFEPDKYV
ncbi:PIN domain-containing protein [Fibrella sp. USSR17]